MEKKTKYKLFFDTETTGLPRDYNAPIEDSDNWPRLVELGLIVMDDNENIVRKRDYIVRPNGFVIPKESSDIHRITTEVAEEKGLELEDVLYLFLLAVKKSDVIIGHNISFDIKIMSAELHRLGFQQILKEKESICTMLKSKDFCKIEGSYGYKWPKLQELYNELFGKDFEEAHNAFADIEATAKCYYKLKELGIIKD